MKHYIVQLLLLSIGITCLLFAWYAYSESHLVKTNWHQVQGKAEKHHQSTHGYETSYSSPIDVFSYTYSYEVNGVEYVKTESVDYQSRVFSRPDKSVTVFYKPDEPEISTIFPHTPFIGITALVVFGCLFILIAICYQKLKNWLITLILSY